MHLLCLRGSDSLDKIGAPIQGGVCDAQSWQRAVDQAAPRTSTSKEKKVELPEEDLKKFPESMVDGMAEQKADELRQYRRRVEPTLPGGTHTKSCLPCFTRIWEGGGAVGGGGSSCGGHHHVESAVVRIRLGTMLGPRGAGGRRRV